MQLHNKLTKFVVTRPQQPLLFAHAGSSFSQSQNCSEFVLVAMQAQRGQKNKFVTCEFAILDILYHDNCK